jgi:hypothetical protein
MRLKQTRRKKKTKRTRRGGANRKVLVLCQRKTGPMANGTVEENIIPHLEAYIHSLFPGDTVTIEYMSSLGTFVGTVDYHSALDATFSEEHKGEYDLVLLNTCPFMFMNTSFISTLLKKNGFMTFKAFTINEGYNITNNIYFPAIDPSFTKIESPLQDEDLHFYSKLV